ncbi:hypothetical protein OESDEN_01555 [Oesophagostomum dentatum]|uniref:SCP domain-containing protein n=1 Tax=Oesophagostomum dentatum TaxID=61180 RepID=A0A0B1TQR1_OESDE|nr:hypothetical protein OESDEN_01555 [Oesophagostomum dentatum]
MSTFRFVLYAVVVLSNAISVDATVYCDANNGQMEEADINSKVLNIVNPKRQEVLAGTQQNGKTAGNMLPAAKDMPDLVRC